MALSEQFKSTSDLKVCIYKAETMGSTTLLSAQTKYYLPVLGPPTILDAQSEGDYSDPIQSQYTRTATNVRRVQRNNMYEISMTLLADEDTTVYMMGCMMEDSTGVAELKGNYTPPTWTRNTNDGQTYVIGIKGGGYNTTDTSATAQTDVFYKGCIGRSFTINHSVDDQGGHPTIEVTFVTGYKPYYIDSLSDPADGWTLTDLNGSGKLAWFVDWHEDNTWIDADTMGHEIHPYGYSVTYERPITGIGADMFSTSANSGTPTHEPFGYMVTDIVSMSMTVTYRRDENMNTFLSRLYDNNKTKICLGESAGWLVYVVGKISESSVDTGNSELRNTLTIEGMQTANSTDTIGYIGLNT